jgi:CrcB-like protein involved in camphor resistance
MSHQNGRDWFVILFVDRRRKRDRRRRALCLLWADPERCRRDFPVGDAHRQCTWLLHHRLLQYLYRPDGRVLAGTTARQFVMVGICGGYTTFSSFSLQTLNLVRDGDVVRALGNINASFVLCLFAVWLGHVAAAALSR